MSVRGTDPSGPQGPSGEKTVSSVGGTEDGNSVPTCTGDSAAWRLGALSSVNRPEGGGNRCWLNEKRAKSIKEEKKNISKFLQTVMEIKIKLTIEIQSKKWF